MYFYVLNLLFYTYPYCIFIKLFIMFPYVFLNITPKAYMLNYICFGNFYQIILNAYLSINLKRINIKIIAYNANPLSHPSFLR